MHISVRDWEDMTPVQLNLYARANAERERERQRQTEGNIYALAALIRAMIWSHDPPAFDTVFPQGEGQEKPREEMSDEAIYAVVKGLNALFGGQEEV